MKKNLNVLSIDFDFFQITTPEIICNCYPDTAMELPDKITKRLWKEYYRIPMYKDKLLTVTANEEKLKEIKDILQNSYISSNGIALKPIAKICKSHKEIYDFITKHYNTKINSNITVTNIDMHPDVDNGNDRLDCGNWIKFIIKKYPNTKIQWIANPISTKTYVNEELTTPLEDEIIKGSIVNNFATIKKQKFDLVFLCRSDIWLPPHLDKEFVKLARYILMHCSECECDKEIFKIRKQEKHRQNQPVLFYVIFFEIIF